MLINVRNTLISFAIIHLLLTPYFLLTIGESRPDWINIFYSLNNMCLVINVVYLILTDGCRNPYYSYYYKQENEEGEMELSYTFQKSFFRKLFRMPAITNTYVKNPDDIWCHKYLGMFPTTKQEKEIAEILEMLRQRKKYEFYMSHVFI